MVYLISTQRQHEIGIISEEQFFRIWAGIYIEYGLQNGCVTLLLREKRCCLLLHSVVGKDGKASHTMKNSNDEAPTVSIEQIASESAKVIQKPSTTNPYGFAYYKEANWWDTHHSGSKRQPDKNQREYQIYCFC